MGPYGGKLFIFMITNRFRRTPERGVKIQLE